MSEKIPVRTDPNYLFAEFQPGDFIGVQHGGFGGSTIPQLRNTLTSTIGLFSSSLSGLVPNSPNATSSYVLVGSGWFPTSNIGGVAGATALSALTDTNISSPANSDVLTWNGSRWVAASAPGAAGGENNTASNLGTGPGSSFASKSLVDLQFRTISGTNIFVSTVGNVILVSGQTSAAFTNASQIDHGGLAGLTDNDHPQYVLSATNNTLSSNVASHLTSTTVHFTSGSLSSYYAGSAWTELRYAGSAHNHALSTLTDTSIGATTTGQVLTWGGSSWAPSTSPAGVTDHGLLTGLTDNDHPQYVLSATNNTLSSNVSNHIASGSVHFTEASINHANIQNIGTNTHAQIDSHIGSIANPHSVTAAQVGNTTAQWNASALRDSALSATLVPITNQALVYNGSVWTASTLTTGGVTDHGALTGLTDNDHPQYVLSATNLQLSSDVSNHIASATVHFTVASIDHGSITGLSDNDHPQYVLSATNNALSSLVTSIQTSTVNLSAYINSNEVNWNAQTAAITQINSQVGPTITIAGASGTNVTSNLNTITISSPSSTTLISEGTNLYYTDERVDDRVNSLLVVTSGLGKAYNDGAGTLTLGADYTSSIWNASALKGSPLSATMVPGNGQALVYNGTVWTASTLPTAAPGGGITSLNGQNGVTQTITVTSGLGLLQGTDTMAIGANYTSAIWNASALVGKKLTIGAIGTNDTLSYDGTDWVNRGGVTLNLEGGPAFSVLGASGTTVTTNTNTITIRSPSSTTLISEGTNLYYTDNRVLTKMQTALIGASGITEIYDEGNETITFGASYTSSIWNASALKGSPLSATLVPTTNQALVYNGTVWTASTLPAGGAGITSLNTQTGAAQTITADGVSGLVLVQGANSITLGAANTSAMWNSSGLRGSPLSATLVPTTNQALIYNGTVWTTSTLPAAGTKPTLSKSVTLLYPLSSDYPTLLMYTPVAITVTSAVAVASPSSMGTFISYNISHSTSGYDRNNGANLNNVFTTAPQVSGTAHPTGLVSSSGFSDNTVPANSYVWFRIIAVPTTPPCEVIFATMIYTED